MATYPVVNSKTGEQKEVIMSVHDWSKWCDDNPDWKRDYIPIIYIDEKIAAVGDLWVCDEFHTNINEHGISIKWNHNF